MEADSQIPDKRELKERYSALVPAFQNILDNLHHLLKPELERDDLHVTVKTRVKSFESYYRKLLRRLAEGQSDADLHRALQENEGVQLTDVLGVRIVCPFLEQVQTACSVVRSLFDVIDIEEKGANRSFREFGYQSTHYLVKIPKKLGAGHLEFQPVCEIQICTLLQDAWAEVEHEIIYKAEFTPFDEPLRRKLAALNANLTLSDIIFQEIREYQRQLHGELGRRRSDFLDRVHGSPNTESNGSSRPKHDVTESSAIGDAQSAAPSLDELLLKALYAHNAKEYTTAIDTYSAILNSRPATALEAIVLVHRGMAYFAGEDYDHALEDFKQAIKTDPQNAKAFYYRGIVYRTTRNFRRALRDFDRSLELNPYDFDTLLSRSDIHEKLGDAAKALEDCENALRIEPDAPEAQSLRSELMAHEHLRS